MESPSTLLLFLIFLVHLLAFAILGVRRRQPYYLALVVTFAVLSAAMAARLLLPDVQVLATLALDQVLRIVALPAGAVSIGWTLMRVRARRARKGNADA